MPELKGTAARVDLVMEEGTKWGPTFYFVADDEETVVPLEEGTTAYLYVRNALGDADALLVLGPGSGLTVSAAEGIVAVSVDAPDTIGIEFAAEFGVWEMVLLPGGRSADAFRPFEGVLRYSRRLAAVPAAEA